jgi:multidrug efflux pump subunit AcrA (membrane-fusion protein)
MPAVAGDGHDHGDAPPAASGNGPKRQPDGSVFLPKPAQRQIGVRTLLVEPGELPRTHELAGKVVMDPNAGGKVQAIVAGRVTPGPRGLPLPGQQVKKGEVLAYVTPEVGGNSRSLAESRLRRLRELSDTVPRDRKSVV